MEAPLLTKAVADVVERAKRKAVEERLVHMVSLYFIWLPRMMMKVALATDSE